VDLIQAVVYGLVQGLTEFLPISSSGHVLLVGELYRHDPGAGFTAVIQLGTVLAVLIYFWGDLVRALRAWSRSFVDPAVRATPEARLGWAVLVGTVPVVVAGLLLEDQIDTVFRSAWIVAAMLIAVALFMGLAELVGKRQRDIEAVQVRDGLWVGLFQALALIPGASRSGSTIMGALFLGMDRTAAARFSFLLSVPSVLGSGFYKLVKDRDILMAEGVAPTVVATLVAFVSGLAAIAFLISFLRRNSTLVFILYRLALGALILVLVAKGIMD
jgi:undecaprenyl-diphosphatase